MKGYSAAALDPSLGYVSLLLYYYNKPKLSLDLFSQFKCVSLMYFLLFCPTEERATPQREEPDVFTPSPSTSSSLSPCPQMIRNHL